ncbi:MAG TPA: hypothetical protein VKI19_09120, partial [Acidimicrobiales bacterium]|nr:hypothetical protein [Acidimicrobiales bacterium]
MTATIERPTRGPGLSARARRRAELTAADRVIRAVLLVAAMVPTAVLVFLAYQMVRQALPAIRFSGGHFFTSRQFNLGNQYGTPEVKNGEAALPKAQFGILAMLFGTLASSVIALVIALPVSVGGAILLV